MEFQRIERELEHCKRICLAWKYVKALNESQTAEENVKVVMDKIDEKTKSITAGEEELKNIEKECDEISKKKDAVCISVKEINSCFYIFVNCFIIFRKKEDN